MTAICGMAMGTKAIPQSCNVHFATANFLLPGGQQVQKKAETNDTATGGE